jgi:serine/threonine-protein kinase
MGRVWLGRHVKLGRHAAIKVLKSEHSSNSELIGRFFDEARAVNQINHEHIVAISDFVEELEPQRVYCIMEYLPGESLDRRLSHEPLPLRESLSVMRQVCEALNAAHKLGIVHRDVKPDNIFLSTKADGSLFAKVLDFGVAKLSPSMKRDSVTTTQSGQMVGTPAYMAPEQIVGIEVDDKADVYGAGTVLYQLLAGHLPFEDADLGKLSMKVIKEPVPALPKRGPLGEPIPGRLKRAVMDALAKEPQQRPSMEQLLEVLRAPPTASRSRLPLFLVAAAVLAAVTGVLLVRAPSAVPAAPVPAVVEPQTVEVSFRTEPAGATVTRAGSNEVLGQTPFTHALKRNSGSVELTFHKDGYADLQRTVGTGANTMVDVVLAKVEQPLSAPPPPPPLPHPAVTDPVRPAKKQKKMQNLSDEGTLDPFGP